MKTGAVDAKQELNSKIFSYQVFNEDYIQRQTTDIDSKGSHWLSSLLKQNKI